MVPTPTANHWFDDIDLDPASPWLAMGTRSLGDRPWLVVDDHRADELALRARLLEEQRDLVFAAPSSADDAVDELAEMVRVVGVEVPGGHEHPLAVLGRTLTEDLVILRRGADEWGIEAGVVCFPSRWNLADRVGRPLQGVHGPTPGYDTVLADRVTSLLDRLGDRIVRRRNWFVHPDPALFQPTRPVEDPVVPAARVFDGLFVRSERQTLRALPRSGRVVFTIKTQQAGLGAFLADPERRRRFVHYVDQAPPDQLDHRGMSADQRAELVCALT